MDSMKKFGEAPGEVYAPKGSLFFARGTKLHSKLIRWAERDPRKKEAESWANHAGVITVSGYLIKWTRHLPMAWASEALWHVENHEWWEAYKNSQGYAIAVFRPRKRNAAQIQAIVDDAATRLGQRYAWWRIPGYGIERLFNINVSRFFFLKGRNVCSNHAALAMEAGGMTFDGVKAAELDPDEMMDYCMSHPEEWEFLGYSIVPAPKPYA